MSEELEPYGQWSRDAEVLAQIGLALSSQTTKLTVRIPRSLADRALAAWRREDDENVLGAETHDQQLVRHRAGFLGLIGLSLETSAVFHEDDAIVELDAWYVGAALDAADQGGLLRIDD